MVISGRRALMHRALATAVLAATAVGPTAAVGTAAARGEGPTTCVGEMSYATVDTLIVPESTNCVIRHGLTVINNVRVEAGGSLLVSGALGAFVVGGNVSVASDASLRVGSALVLEGSLVAHQPAEINLTDYFVGTDILIRGGAADGVLVYGGNVGGNASIVGVTAPSLTLRDSRIAGQLSLINNDVSAGEIEYNTVGGSMVCHGNGGLSFTGNAVSGNTVGQCG